MKPASIDCLPKEDKYHTDFIDYQLLAFVGTWLL
jgi:hypothetical protein